MGKNCKCLLSLITWLCAWGITSKAQLPDYADTKEKVYVHTNHVFFKPGETLFFKLYVVNAARQTPSPQSGIVYTEIISPAGTTLQKLQYKVEDGYAEGSFSFDEQAPGGVYKLKAYTTWMRNERDSSFFVKEITLQKVIAPRVLMKLEFPEKGYGPGDAVTARFSMRNLDDAPIKNYPAQFTVSIGGATVETTAFKTDNEGKSLVQFYLPNNLQTSDGLLNITVHYDAYTEAISRSIPIVLNAIDCQFMPEGGTLIEGIATHIAFRAVNEQGKPVDVKGEILDNNGALVTTFESYQFGMGKFAFTPQQNKHYSARILTPAKISQRFALPAAMAKGVVMNVQKTANQVTLQLLSTDKREVNITGSTKSVLYYQQRLTLQKGMNTIAVNEQQFPMGIARFTLATIDGQPLAERMVFLNEQRHLQVHITPDKKTYQPREKVSLTIQTTDEQGQPLPSNLSIAVVDDKLWSFADDKQDHIVSWLLMSSELSGKIEEPAFYFKEDEPKAIPALDLVMLTHGYRYFDFTATVQNTGVLQFLPDQGNMVSGRVCNGQGQPVAATVFLINPTYDGKAMRFNTSNDGLFFFSDLPAKTGYYLLAQPYLKKEKITINILQQGIGFNPIKAAAFRERMQFGQLAARRPVPELAVKNMAPGAQQPAPAANQPQPQFNGFFKGAAQLNDVVVVGYGTARRQMLAGSVAAIRAEEVSGNAVMALQGRVPGLEVQPNAHPLDDTNILLRGARSVTNATPPLFVVNGVPLEQFNLNTLTPSDISSITVLKDADATSVYGARAAYGVVIIETKKFRTEKIRFDLSRKFYCASQQVQTYTPTYSVARRFYAPRYASLVTPVRNDFRETIYWNPVVQTDKDGTAAVEFYNSDATTTFRAIAEGIGYNGKAGHTESTYVVKNVLSVDAKIPPYLTVGDKALLPLIVKNNSSQPLPITIHLRLPQYMQAGGYPVSLSLPPDSAQQITIPVKATSALHDTIQFIVETDFNTEKIALPITAAEKGFEVIQTFSGNKTAQHPFIVNKMIPGSMQTKLKLYTSLEGQLLDGIASMLREPHGCFEQTSSSTYPNIYVLKYLRESGKSNAAIEKQALQYIEDGYKRLIGFETALNGFEWFGHTPPHEALTAYGLLEFTDMQEFVNVDKSMLARTKNFLMSRRDGKGSFKLSTGGYDRFAAVPNKIANLYIVYALTQAGVGKDIEPEYQTAVKQALESNDAYLLSMMALAASNMHNSSDYNRLMTVLNNHFQQSKWNAETSVVNSRESSLRVETWSLYALALMREASPQTGVIAGVISKILAEKTYYGYGATQATVLALQAIVEYTKLAGRASDHPQITFTMNDQPVVADNPVTQQVQEGNNLFTVHYGDPRQSIPYNLEIAYHTLTPPNSEKAELKLATRLAKTEVTVGETVRLQIDVNNTKNNLQPMAIAKIGIPAGLSAQPWQLKEIMEKNQVAYYELFDNYLVLYWMGFAAGETKTIHLDLKAEIAGTYKGKASNTYLYYMPEYKHWNEGLEVEVK